MSVGITDDSRCYTIKALAELLGYRQARSLERLLLEIQCPVRKLGGKKLVSGKQFRLAIERSPDVRLHSEMEFDSA